MADIHSKVPNDLYLKGWDEIFGKAKKVSDSASDNCTLQQKDTDKNETVPRGLEQDSD